MSDETYWRAILDGAAGEHQAEVAAVLEEIAATGPWSAAEQLLKLRKENARLRARLEELENGE